MQWQWYWPAWWQLYPTYAAIPAWIGKQCYLSKWFTFGPLQMHWNDVCPKE